MLSLKNHFFSLCFLWTPLPPKYLIPLKRKKKILKKKSFLCLCGLKINFWIPMEYFLASAVPLKSEQWVCKFTNWPLGTEVMKLRCPSLVINQPEMHEGLSMLRIHWKNATCNKKSSNLWDYFSRITLSKPYGVPQTTHANVNMNYFHLEIIGMCKVLKC